MQLVWKLAFFCIMMQLRWRRRWDIGWKSCVFLCRRWKLMGIYKGFFLKLIYNLYITFCALFFALHYLRGQVASPPPAMTRGTSGCLLLKVGAAHSAASTGDKGVRQMVSQCAVRPFWWHCATVLHRLDFWPELCLKYLQPSPSGGC